VRRLAIVLPWLVAAAGCPSTPAKPVATPTTVTTRDDEAGLARLYTELADDILSSYERDEPPDVDTTTIDPKVGTARIGAGPGDVSIAGDLARAASRWPLEIDRSTRTEVRSKHLAIQIAADQSAAWIADELSWRIEMCGRIAVIPLRITALYAHDGDRWVPVFEHLSFGFRPTPIDAAAPKPIKSAAVSAELDRALRAVVERGLIATPHDPVLVAQDAGALVLGPDAADEWHGAAVITAAVPPGTLEDHRVGTVGRGGRDATIAYWIGNYTADIAARPEYAAGKVGMRVTFVFEKRPFATRAGNPPDALACARPQARDTGIECRWVLVQSQFSQPITDDYLTRQVFGTALVSSKPLALDCGDGTVTTPGAGPRPVAGPPAARTP
jgi:hypothetical protein